MKRIAFLCAFCASVVSFCYADMQVPTLQWDVDLRRPSTYTLPLYRGETIALQPRFLQNASTPYVIPSNAAVELRYKSSNMTTSYYPLVGSVQSSTNGRVTATWTALNESTNSTYIYTYTVTADGIPVLRCNGTITLTDTVGGTPTNVPTSVSQYILRTEYEATNQVWRTVLTNVQDRCTALETGKLDLTGGTIGGSLTVSGVVTGSFAGDGSSLTGIVAVSTAGVASVTCQAGITNTGTAADVIVGLTPASSNRLALAITNLTDTMQTVYQRSTNAFGDCIVTNTGAANTYISICPPSTGDGLVANSESAETAGVFGQSVQGIGVWGQAYSSGQAAGRFWGYNGVPALQLGNISAPGGGIVTGGIWYGGSATFPDLMPEITNLARSVSASVLSTGKVNAANVTNSTWLYSTSSLNYSMITNPPAATAAVYRYAARSTSGSEIYVTATATGVTATLSGATATFTIPTNCIPLTAQLRIPSGSGTTLTIAVGTNWCANTGWADRWGMSACVYREDTGAQVTSASTKLSPTTFTEGQVLGLVDSVVSRVCITFQ